MHKNYVQLTQISKWQISPPPNAINQISAITNFVAVLNRLDCYHMFIESFTMAVLAPNRSGEEKKILQVFFPFLSLPCLTFMP